MINNFKIRKRCKQQAETIEELKEALSGSEIARKVYARENFAYVTAIYDMCAEGVISEEQKAIILERAGDYIMLQQRERIGLD